MNAARFIGTFVISAIILFLGIYLQNGFTETATRINIRLSARFSGILFAIAFGASSFQYFVKGMLSFVILANRKIIGVSFAILHLIHFLFLGILQYFFHPTFEVTKITLVEGIMAYIVVLIMLSSSFEPIKSWYSHKNWVLVHTIGGYWIWFIFFKSYLKRVSTEAEYIPLFLLFVFVILLRFMKLYRLNLKKKQ